MFTSVPTFGLLLHTIQREERNGLQQHGVMVRENSYTVGSTKQYPGHTHQYATKS